MSKKVILHLCADIGSDSIFYQQDPNYKVIMVGKEIGVENFTPHGKVHGIIANPPCTSFSTANGFHKKNDLEDGLFLVNHCLRIIEEANPEWWVLENPFNGRLKDIIGKPVYSYQPWQYGSPWTKKTALWGNFNIPPILYKHWDDVPKIESLYTRPGRPKPSLAFMHKSSVEKIHEMQWAKDFIHTDADFRSMCSSGFAEQFYKYNK